MDTTTIISCSLWFLHGTCFFITVTTECPALQTYGMTERNVVGTNIETVNYLKLEVCMVSDRCHCFPWKSCPTVSWWVLLGTLEHFGVFWEPQGEEIKSIGVWSKSSKKFQPRKPLARIAHKEASPFDPFPCFCLVYTRIGLPLTVLRPVLSLGLGTEFLFPLGEQQEVLSSFAWQWRKASPNHEVNDEDWLSWLGFLVLSTFQIPFEVSFMFSRAMVLQNSIIIIMVEPVFCFFLVFFNFLPVCSSEQGRGKPYWKIWDRIFMTLFKHTVPLLS